MPYVVSKLNGKKFPFPTAMFFEEDIERWRGGSDVYEVVNVTTRRKMKVGGHKAKPKSAKKRR
jgi:hypothetical protein